MKTTTKFLVLSLLSVVLLSCGERASAQTSLDDKIEKWLTAEGYKSTRQVDSDGDTWHTFKSQGREVYVLTYTDRPNQIRVGVGVRLDAEVPMIVKLTAANMTMNKYVDVRAIIDDEEDILLQVDTYIGETSPLGDILEYSLAIIGSADDRYMAYYDQLREALTADEAAATTEK